MPSEALKEILHSSRFLNNALHSVDRELDIAERDIEEKNYSALGNDIFRGKTSLKTAVDEANDIDATTRQALGMSKKEYKRIKFNSSGVRSTSDMRNRHGYETITHSGRVTFPTTPKKDEIKDAVTSAISSAPASATKKTAEIAIGDDDISGAVSHALGKETREIYTEPRTAYKLTKKELKEMQAIKPEDYSTLKQPHKETFEMQYLNKMDNEYEKEHKKLKDDIASAVDSALISHPGEASTAE